MITKLILPALILVLSLFVIAIYGTTCGDPPCEQKWGYYGSGFDFEVNATQQTPKGTKFDPTSQNISGELIDRLTDELETCLASVDTSTLTGDCSPEKMKFPIDRSSFVVKLPNDWALSCDGEQQQLSVLAPSTGGCGKGLDPTQKCPCKWRAGLMCPNTVVTTPSFYLYKDALARLWMNCTNPWEDPQIAACVSPTTLPLSDGTDPRNGLK